MSTQFYSILFFEEEPRLQDILEDSVPVYVGFLVMMAKALT